MKPKHTESSRAVNTSRLQGPLRFGVLGSSYHLHGLRDLLDVLDRLQPNDDWGSKHSYGQCNAIKLLQDKFSSQIFTKKKQGLYEVQDIWMLLTVLQGSHVPDLPTVMEISLLAISQGELKASTWWNNISKSESSIIVLYLYWRYIYEASSLFTTKFPKRQNLLI